MSDVRLYPEGTSIGYPAAFQLEKPVPAKPIRTIATIAGMGIFLATFMT
jgi:hypothetical protein